MADAYRKVGRGGAGNFYSQKDVEEASRNAESSRDLEAQKPAPANEAPTDPADAPVPFASSSAEPSEAPVRTGRGGAGNYVDPLTASSGSIISGAKPRPATVHSTGNPTAANQHPSGNGQQPLDPTASSSTGTQRAAPRLSGRGGAGNWSGGETSEQHKVVIDEEQERKRKEALDKGIFDDVRASLREPSRAHTRIHPHGRGGGPRGLEES